MSIFLAILAAAVVFSIGFLVSLVAPRWVRWDLRTPVMVGIWVISFALGLTAFVVIV